MSKSMRVASVDGLHVLIAGGGVAALEAAFALRALAGDRVDLELLAPEPLFFYLPHAVYEPFGGLRVQQFELAELALALEAQHTLDQLASVLPNGRIARTRNGMMIPYDVLLVACGVSPRPLLRGALSFRGPADSDRVAAIVRDARRRASPGAASPVLPEGDRLEQAQRRRPRRGRRDAQQSPAQDP